MNILSRIFINTWFKSLVASLVALIMLVTTADIINGFLRGKAGSQVLLEWALKMPDLVGKIIPVTCLLATLFSLQRLKSHNELIAALAAGLSHLRITLLLGACALSMVILQFANLGFVEPLANKVKRQQIKKSQASEGRYLTRGALDGGQFWFKSEDYFATFLSFDKKAGVLADIRFYYFDKRGGATHILKARRASHLGGSNWRLEGGEEISDLQGPTFPRVTPFQQREMSLAETPDDFKEFEADLTTLSWFALSDFIQKIAPTGINTAEYRILLHQKLALSGLCLVFALLPMGGLYQPNRRSDSFGKSVGFALVLTVLFWLLFSASLSYGQSEKLPAWLSAYLVPGLFLCHSGWTFWRHRKLAF